MDSFALNTGVITEKVVCGRKNLSRRFRRSVDITDIVLYQPRSKVKQNEKVLQKMRFLLLKLKDDKFAVNLWVDYLSYYDLLTSLFGGKYVETNSSPGSLFSSLVAEIWT